MKDKRQQIAEIITQTHKTPLEQADEILLLFSVIDSFDFDATELTPKEQFELRMLMSTGKVKIKIVL